MGIQEEMMGRELARLMGRELERQIHALASLKEERKESLKGFQLREQAILKEIHRLAMDVRLAQTALDLRERSK